MIQFIDTKQILNELDPRSGIGDDLLNFVLKLVPYTGIELYIKNEKNEFLLSYRNDEFYHGWHFIGGMLRCRESWANRIIETAIKEIGVEIEFDELPFFVKENWNEKIDPRGHSINLLFRASIKKGNESNLRLWDGTRNLCNGDLYWFSKRPENILEMHKVYFEL